VHITGTTVGDPMHELFSRIEAAAKEAGAAKVGFANIMALKDMQVGDETVFGFSSAVTVMVEIPMEAVRRSLDSPSEEMRAAYKQCNMKLKKAEEKVVETLVAAGYKARSVDPSERINKEMLLGPISHKAVARLAGMGWIGKNGLIITEDFGPRLRMGTVLTDMPVAKNPEPSGSDCGDCTACVDNCPMKVLKGPEFSDYPKSRDLVIDWAKCGKYEHTLIGDGSRPEKACGRCIAKCPRSGLGL
jgi:epoxyqueuosine reductase